MDKSPDFLTTNLATPISKAISHKLHQCLSFKVGLQNPSKSFAIKDMLFAFRRCWYFGRPLTTRDFNKKILIKFVILNISTHYKEMNKNKSIQRLFSVAKPELKTLIWGLFFLIVSSISAIQVEKISKSLKIYRSR